MQRVKLNIVLAGFRQPIIACRIWKIVQDPPKMTNHPALKGIFGKFIIVNIQLNDFVYRETRLHNVYLLTIIGADRTENLPTIFSSTNMAIFVLQT